MIEMVVIQMKYFSVTKIKLPLDYFQGSYLQSILLDRETFSFKLTFAQSKHI